LKQKETKVTKMKMHFFEEGVGNARFFFVIFVAFC
jgi:hypothetical protein